MDSSERLLQTDRAVLNESDFRRLSALQRSLLPTSIISRLGDRYCRSFYRYAASTRFEFVAVELSSDGNVVACCVLSTSIGSLSRRLALHTRLLPALAVRPHVLFDALRPNKASAKGEPELLLLFTDPATQGRGAGTRLVARCDDFLSACGVTSYVVRTIDDPESRAYRFYVSRGFVPEQSVEAHGQHFVVMRRRSAAKRNS
jgi:GNAT superfamily N-acetyltransferase